MAIAGLLHYVENSAIASVSAALKMVESVKDHPSGWQVRAGLHMGPLVGGVIGQKNYAFDIWGDTVNIASRIVGQAEPSTVLVSEGVWRNLQDSFDGRSRGMVELKGKGGAELIECITR